jgi:hypothetical protein
MLEIIEQTVNERCDFCSIGFGVTKYVNRYGKVQKIQAYVRQTCSIHNA